MAVDSYARNLAAAALSNGASEADLEAEATAREQGDANLQQQVDAIVASSDVRDVVGTYAELQAYDTSKLGDNDIIKVLDDETKDNARTYYRWKVAESDFEYIGSEGATYTKSEMDAKLQEKQDLMQYEVMPEASAENVGDVVQYIGETEEYTQGHFYTCTTDGAETPSYQWVEISFGGGSDTKEIPEYDFIISSTATSGNITFTDEEKAEFERIINDFKQKFYPNDSMIPSQAPLKIRLMTHGGAKNGEIIYMKLGLVYENKLYWGGYQIVPSNGGTTSVKLVSLDMTNTCSWSDGIYTHTASGIDRKVKSTMNLSNLPLLESGSNIWHSDNYYYTAPTVSQTTKLTTSSFVPKFHIERAVLTNVVPKLTLYYNSTSGYNNINFSKTKIDGDVFEMKYGNYIRYTLEEDLTLNPGDSIYIYLEKTESMMNLSISFREVRIGSSTLTYSYSQYNSLSNDNYFMCAMDYTSKYSTTFEAGKTLEIKVDSTSLNNLTRNTKVMIGTPAVEANRVVDNFNGESKSQHDINAELDNAIKEVELVKFPNVTIFGNPTIQQGQISGFTMTDYLEFPFLVDFRGNPFEINFAFTTGTNVDTQQNILDSQFGLAFAIRDKHVVLAISVNGTSWLTEQTGTLTLQPQTSYRYRITWNRLVYKVQYSTDGGQTYVDDISFAQNYAPYPKQMYIGVGKLADNYFEGIINLNYANVKVADQLIWQGLDDVGLSTRLATDMSNIDMAGVNYINRLIDAKVISALESEY